MLAWLMLLLFAAGCTTRRSETGARAPGAAVGASSASPRWGGPVHAPEAERSVREFLRRARQSPQQARRSCAALLVVMPALWQHLAASDPSLEGVGMARALLLADHRVVVHVLTRGDDMRRLLGSPGFVQLARVLVAAPRPASEQERELTFRLVLGGIDARTPVTIVQSGNLRVAFLLEHDKVFWMEVLSGWQPSEWARRATPSTERCGS